MAEAFGSEGTCGFETEEVRDVHGNLLVFSTEFVSCEVLLPTLTDPEDVDGVGDSAQIGFDESPGLTQASLNACVPDFAIAFNVIGDRDPDDLRDIAVDLTRTVIEHLP